MERGPYRHQFRSRFLSFLDTIHRSDEGGRRCPSLLPPCVLISVERPRNGGECVHANSLVDRQRDGSFYFGPFRQRENLQEISCVLFLPEHGPLRRVAPLCHIHLATESSSRPLLVHRIRSGDCRLPGHPRNLQGRAEELTGCSTHCTDFSFVCVGRSHIESYDECAKRSCLVTSGNLGRTRTKPAHSPVAVVVWHRRIACLLSDPDQQKPQRDHIRI